MAIDSEGSPVSRPLSSGRSLKRACEKVLLHSAAYSTSYSTPDAIVAHGTGTLLNDQIEDHVISELFTESPPITGTKWCTGHTLGASGAVDLLAGAEILMRQQIFPLARTKQVDCSFKNNYVTVDQGVQTKVIERVLVTSLGFGGNHAALSLRRHE